MQSLWIESEIVAYPVGIVLALVLIYLLGLLVETGLKNRWNALVDSIINRVPCQAYYGVLIPTAPVPFGGAILYVPADWVEPVDITFDGLVNVYMSMGATSADYLQGQTTPRENAAEPSGVLKT